MAASIFIATEPQKRKTPLWTELETTELRPQFFDTVQYRKSQVGQPLWTELADTELRPQFFDTVQYRKSQVGQPLWTELADAIRPQAFETEPEPTQPFIDGLAPVTVGSDFRHATMQAAKLDNTGVLTVLFPAPAGSMPSNGTIVIPAGDRIPEFGDILVENNYALPAGPGLIDSRTIILINGDVVYMNSMAAVGWTVLAPPNLINGFDYRISGPITEGPVTVSIYLEGVESFLEADFSFDASAPTPPGGGGDLRYRLDHDPDRNSGPRQEDGSLQSDLLSVTGVQNITTFDGGTLDE